MGLREPFVRTCAETPWTSAIGTAQALRFAAIAAIAVRGTASATRLPSRSFAAR